MECVPISIWCFGCKSFWGSIPISGNKDVFWSLPPTPLSPKPRQGSDFTNHHRRMGYSIELRWMRNAGLRCKWPGRSLTGPSRAPSRSTRWQGRGVRRAQTARNLDAKPGLRDKRLKATVRASEPPMKLQLRAVYIFHDLDGAVETNTTRKRYKTRDTGFQFDIKHDQILNKKSHR